MRILAILFILSLFTGCGQTPEPARSINVNQVASSKGFPAFIGQIPTPPGYKRLAAEQGSFTAWLRRIPLKKKKEVYLYNGSLKPNQSAQYAVVEMAVGNRDLQQCADVVMRLRSEFLFANQRFHEIRFMDYSSKWYIWNDAENRPRFDQYLQQVFGWCGSASLEKQSTAVKNFESVEPGDVLIKGGFPGHAMLVTDMAVNDKGHKIYMLVQGYQPAQDIHVVINPGDSGLSPWYDVEHPGPIITPEWTFEKNQLRRW